MKKGKNNPSSVGYICPNCGFRPKKPKHLVCLECNHELERVIDINPEELYKLALRREKNGN